MYHPVVVRARIAAAERQFNRDFAEHTVEEVASWIHRLKDCDPTLGDKARPLTSEESAFIQNELILSKFDYVYWASRYCKINRQGDKDAVDIVAPMCPMLESQDFVLSKIAEAEKKQFDSGEGVGIRVNVLKASRQVGVSTLAESIGSHRITTQNGIFGLIAGDAPEQSGFLFDMMERMIDLLPWWLAPKISEHVKNTELVTDGGSSIWVGSGKSTRGTTGARGQLGRGRSLTFVHLSELAQWETADQLRGSLFPTIPQHPRVIIIFETTAKGQGTWWQKHWEGSRRGRSDFIPVFIPWYVEKKRYSRRAPDDWVPLASTVAHARRCIETSPQWLGKHVDLNRDQLYWYERTRIEHEEAGELSTFLEEYGAIDDVECFQASGKSIFGADMLQRVRDKARPLATVAEIMPRSAIQ